MSVSSEFSNIDFHAMKFKAYFKQILLLSGTLLMSSSARAQEYSLDSFRAGFGGSTSSSGDITVSGVIQPLSPPASFSGQYTIAGEFISVVPGESNAVPTGSSTLYVANYREIRRLTAEGVGSVFATNGLVNAQGIAFDRAGNLYVANAAINTIVKFTPFGIGSLFADTGLNNPAGLAFDRSGNLYVANLGLNNIAKFTPDGSGTVFAKTGLKGPLGLAFDAAGNLFAANFSSASITKFTPEGVSSVFAVDPGDGSRLPAPMGVAFDRKGNLYVANSFPGNMIVKFTPDGAGSVFARNLNGPTGLAVDSKDNLYVVTRETIEKFTPDGTRSTFALNENGNYVAFADRPGDGAPPPELRITAAVRVGKELRLTLSPAASGSYEIESLTDLGASQWATFPAAAISGAAGTVEIRIPIELGRSRQFFRVRALP